MESNNGMNRSTGMRCPVCCAKAGEAHVQGCNLNEVIRSEAIHPDRAALLLAKAALDASLPTHAHYSEPVARHIAAQKAVAQALAAPALGGNHPDDFAIDACGAAQKAKMRAGREKGRAHWNDPLMCSTTHLQSLLIESVVKGDPIDTANYAMMLHTRGARTMPAPISTGDSINDLTEAYRATKRNIDMAINQLDQDRRARMDRRKESIPVAEDRRRGASDRRE